ncbi:hypothetical protein [Streptomyces phaeochromogenes]
MRNTDEHITHWKTLPDFPGIEYAFTEELDPDGTALWIRKFVNGEKYCGLSLVDEATEEIAQERIDDWYKTAHGRYRI